MTFKQVLIEKLDELLQAYSAGRCDAYTTDASGLAAVRVAQPRSWASRPRTSTRC